MRFVAGFLAFITLLALGLLAFVWHGAYLVVSETSFTVYSATEQRENYESVRLAIEEGSFTGTVLQDASFRMPETYEFVVYNVRSAQQRMASGRMDSNANRARRRGHPCLWE